MEELENKIKALGKAVFALDERWKYIACDKDGFIAVFEEKPILNKKHNCWNSVIGDVDINMRLNFALENCKDLCFSREECENAENATTTDDDSVCKKNLPTEFTADENAELKAQLADVGKLVKPLEWEELSEERFKARLPSLDFEIRFAMQKRYILELYKSGRSKYGGSYVIYEAFETVKEAQDYAQQWLVDFVRSACKGGGQ